MNRFQGLSKPSLLASGVLLTIGNALRLLPNGGKPSTLIQTPLFTVSALALLAGGLLLVLALMCLYVRRAAHIGSLGFAAALVAGTGTVLLCGIYWGEAFVLPVVAHNAPRIVDGAWPARLAIGYGMAHVIFGVGWVLAGVVLVRARMYGLYPPILMMVGAVASLLPFVSAGELVLALSLVWLAFTPAYAANAYYRRAEPAKSTGVNGDPQ
jgi:hypothetical protein